MVNLILPSTRTNFDKIAADETEKLKIELTQSMTAGDRVMPLENFTTAIDTSELIPRSTGSNGLSSDPPKIFTARRRRYLSALTASRSGA